MATPIQSTAVPFEISYDGGLTWKVLVCLSGWTAALDTTSTTVDTQCGRFYGLGPIGGSPTVNAVCSLYPASNEVTYKDMVAAQKAQTLLDFRVQYPGAGSVGYGFYLHGQIQVLNTTLTDETNNPIKFAVTFGIQGTVAIVPGT